MDLVVLVIVVGVVIYAVRKAGGVKAAIAKVKEFFRPKER